MTPVARPRGFQETSARPLVGISCCYHPHLREPIHGAIERYVKATVEFAEVDAVLLPAMAGALDFESVIARLDAVLLTGSPSNLSPSYYGNKCLGEPPFDPARDALAMRLIEATITADKPLFGICRGLQEINVAFGGTLRTDLGQLDRTLQHHSPSGASFEQMFEPCHTIRLTPEGVLHRWLGKEELEVNSVHFQGIADLGSGLSIEAHASDGIIEAIAARPNSSAVLAVQWHPEWDVGAYPDRMDFFRLVGSAARGEQSK